MQLLCCSWNCHDKNLKAKMLLTSVMGLNPEVVCFQEVPHFLVDEIEQNKNYVCRLAPDLTNNGQESHLCILVRKGIKVTDYREVAHTAKPYNWFWGDVFGMEWNMCLNSQSLLITKNGERVRIVNCHLGVTGSITARHRMLEEITSAHTTKGESVIFSGDLNTFGCWVRNSVAGWFFGIRKSELLTNEQDLLNIFLKKWDLVRAFPRRTITHYMSFFSNLDHVLHSVDLKVSRRKLLPSRHNSDHRGLLVLFEKVKPVS